MNFIFFKYTDIGMWICSTPICWLTIGQLYSWSIVSRNVVCMYIAPSIWNYKSNIVYYANHTQSIELESDRNSHFSIPRFRCYAQRNTLTFYKRFCEISFLFAALFPVTFIWFYIKYGKDVILSCIVATPQRGVYTYDYIRVCIVSSFSISFIDIFKCAFYKWTKF